MEKRSCRICGRSFPSGRSLGGHMRSHVVMSSSLNYEEKLSSGYGLRENPRKSWRFDEAWTNMEKEQEDSWRNGVEDEEKGEVEIQTDREIPRRRQQRRRSKTVEMISDSSSPLPSSPEYGALCLMLLSRGASSCSDSSHSLKRSESDCSKIGLMEAEFFASEYRLAFDDDDDDDDDESKKSLEITVLESGKRNKSSRSNFSSGAENYFKRSRYECTICNKSFHSYQALGGHCASHKKDSADTFSVSPAAKGLISGKFRAHQCPICGKVFASGQALGGHKRSHLISNGSSEIEQKNPLDLNLPAPGYAARDSFDSNGSSDEIKFTAFEKSCRLQACMI